MAAIARLHLPTNQIRITSCLFLYGSEAKQNIGDLIIEEINRMYNEPGATALVNGVHMPVLFDISFEVIATSDAVNMVTSNESFHNNFIRIEAENYVTRSFMGFGLGDNSGHWLTSDNLGTSTTAAHEFGHSLGLDHPANPDFRGSSSPPPIMAARGSFVDPQYQWNPLVKAGEYGGTMNPIHRRVSKEEISMILEGLTFEETETYYIGYLSNNLFDRKGMVV